MKVRQLKADLAQPTLLSALIAQVRITPTAISSLSSHITRGQYIHARPWSMQANGRRSILKGSAEYIIYGYIISAFKDRRPLQLCNYSR